jgi:DNA-binding NarL/FixJ family response regulator
MSETEHHHEGPLRLLLVDDQPLLRMGFRLVLESEDGIEVVGEAGNGAEAVKLAESLRPDVVLMDVRMPVMDGIEATRRIAAAHSSARIIILTTFDLDEYAFSGLQAGASAFLLKDVAPAELVQAVRLVASEGAGDLSTGHGVGIGVSVAIGIINRTTRAVIGALDLSAPGNGGTAADPLLKELTPRELEVLRAICEGLSNAEIAHRFFLSEATVKSHVRRILTKLHLRDRVQAVVYGYETGLIIPSNPDY